MNETAAERNHVNIAISSHSNIQTARENKEYGNRGQLSLCASGNRDAGISAHNESETGLSASQRMLAACTGSLLTSLLVTPLDIVRVRLQAQQHTHSSSDAASSTFFSSSTSPRVQKSPLPPLQFKSTFARFPQDLGVTACCREVFWVNGESELCVASVPSTSSSTSSTSRRFVEACAIEEHSRRNFTGTWDGLVKIARYEGVNTLWRGLSPTLVMAIPANVIYFTGYDWLKSSHLSPFSGLPPTWTPLLAGAAARTIAATAISPLELFRTRLWASTTASHTDTLSREVSAFKETFVGLVNMVKMQGWTSLWRGLSLTLWRDVPFSGIYWFGVETIKKFLRKEREKHPRFQHFGHFDASATLHRNASHGTFTDSFIAGAVSGAVAAFLTTPFDVGKTRIQVSEVNPLMDRAAVQSRYGTASDGVRESMPRFLYGIYQREGLRGLWKGCVPRMLKVAPACAIMISTYDVGKQWAAKMNQRKRPHEN